VQRRERKQGGERDHAAARPAVVPCGQDPRLRMRHEEGVGGTGSGAGRTRKWRRCDTRAQALGTMTAPPLGKGWWTVEGLSLPAGFPSSVFCALCSVFWILWGQGQAGLRAAQPPAAAPPPTQEEPSRNLAQGLSSGRQTRDGPAP